MHRTPPPDLVIPPGYTRTFWRGDLGGVMLPTAPPWVPGCNTTPPEMTMSFLLPKYQQFGVKQIDAFLTAHAERNYSHFHLDRSQADDAGLSDTQFVDLIAYVQSWGFFTSCWLSGSRDDRSRGWASIGPRITTFLDVLEARGQRVLDRFIALPGEELNNGCPPGPAGADAIIRGVCARTTPVGVPTWLHLTSNYADYPPNPRTDASAVVWWQQWIGQLQGLCWQADPNAPAGLMGAKLWDARRILGRADPAFLTVAFELRAEAQLYGRCTEEQGCLTGLELLYCDNDGLGYPEVAGFGNGARSPEGRGI